MGDGDATTNEKGTELWYVPPDELRRLAGWGEDAYARAALFADACRLNVLYMVKRAGSGHIGTSFSSIDIMSWLFLEELRPAAPRGGEGDVFFSSKGHDAPALYAVLTARGLLPFDGIHELRREGGLPGHPHVETPYIQTNTGSLGMGISKAKGMAQARRRFGREGRIFVLLGDGELQEGQLWESLQGAARDGLSEITVLVDMNGIQSDTWCADVLDMSPVAEKFSAFGWNVETCDGHSPREIAAAILRARAVTAKPTAILARTVKGKGVAAFEGRREAMDGWRYLYHSGAPSDEAYARAVAEVRARLEGGLSRIGAQPLRLERVSPPAHRDVRTLRRLIPAYTEALIEAAAADARIVALDADLILDTGLIPFRERFPDRFFECGIAEQDMVSQAGGMALQGLVPFVHSFAAFLAARPNEQIYNNASEGTRIVYVGSLAGLLPGGPGHSHQAVRDISALAAVPGMLLIEPSCEEEVRQAVRFAAAEAPGSCYLRLASVAMPIPYEMPEGYRLTQGRGVVLREGRDVVLISHGPVMLTQVMEAADHLAGRGVESRVVSFPWLNVVDPRWLGEVTKGPAWTFAVEDHYARGGQAEMLLAAIAEQPALRHVKSARIALQALPICGKNDEVLRAHGLDAVAIAERVLATLEKGE